MFRMKGKNGSETFVLELPLLTTKSTSDILERRFEAARHLYNACLGEAKRRLSLVRQAKDFQKTRNTNTSRERSRMFRQINERYGFREYDLHAYAAKIKNACWIGDHLDINTVQKLATRAFRAVQRMAFGRARNVRFKGRGQVNSVEGKTNNSGILFRQDVIRWGKVQIPIVVDAKDPVVVHGLQQRVKYVRIVRRNMHGKKRYYAQLVLEGTPYQKHKFPDGIVGLDLGPSSIAVVGDGDAFLTAFGDELEDLHREIRVLQRKLDRQRRSNNPQNYNPDKTIRPGKKRWHVSRRMRKTQNKLRELQRRQAAHRKTLHGRLGNDVLSMGLTVRMEKLSYRAFQRQFGRSVGFRAPGTFVEMLRRKAESAGGKVEEFSTRATALSQTCLCGRREKKSLSQRIHMCPECGVQAQRDLFSAFLARFVEDETLDLSKAGELWPGADSLLGRALDVANGRATVLASFGRSPGVGATRPQRRL